MTKRLLVFASAFVFALGIAQKSRPVLTGAPFLRVAPDPVSGGLGSQGVATAVDAYSQYWNPSKFVHSKEKTVVGATFTPYMNNLVKDVFLIYGGFSTFLDKDRRSAISGSMYYYNMGNVPLTSLVGAEVIDDGVAKPQEMSLDMSYSLKLSETYSMAVTARYIRSDLVARFSSSNVDFREANTFGIDISGYYLSKEFSALGMNGRTRFGFNLSNIGPKLDYTYTRENKSYLPMSLRVGAGYDFILDNKNKVALTGEASKILVPQAALPEGVSAENADNSQYRIPDYAVISGIAKSFEDENFVETLLFSGGLEYNYNDMFKLRTGYFHESLSQGARQYLTFGLGVKYASFGIDFSYLLNVSKVNQALDNNLRFGLSWYITK